MGAWIEINAATTGGQPSTVAPAWGRGLKCLRNLFQAPVRLVAPAWGRGLKCRRQPVQVVQVIVAPAWGRGLKSDTTLMG